LFENQVYRLSLLAYRISQNPIDIFFSHDWPQGIWDYGDVTKLLKIKPYFREDMISGKLGSPPLMMLLKQLQPTYWFAGHLHVKFPAIFHHHNDHIQQQQQQQQQQQHDSSGSGSGSGNDKDQQANSATSTKFLALDKVQPGRDFLQIIEIPAKRDVKLSLEYDPEWLAILRKTHNLLTTQKNNVNMPYELLYPTEEVTKISPNTLYIL
jgi:lariat debranching enzyme